MNDFLFALALLLFLLLDLAAVAARGAYLQTSHARLLALRERMEKDVSESISLLHALARLRASLGLLLTWSRFALLAFALVYTLPLLPQWNGLAAGLILVLGGGFLLFTLEWLVERSVGRNPETWALRFIPFVRITIALLSLPLALPLSLTRDSEPISDTGSGVTADELKTLVDAGQQEGVLEQGERRMIHSIFDLGDTRAREIMVPRIDMLALEASLSVSLAVESMLRSGHSRVPVFEETVDRMLGLLYAKDLLRVWSEGGQLQSLRDLLRPAYFVPEAKRVDEMLAEMQSRRIHMAIVVDEYGGVAGLVTLEDIIEEILGEIRDEYDQLEEAVYQELPDGQFLFLGRIGLDDFNEVLGSEIIDEADTLGGYIYSRLGRVPAVGDEVRVGNLLLIIEQVSARRIRKVRARWLTQEETAQQDEVQKNADH